MAAASHCYILWDEQEYAQWSGVTHNTINLQVCFCIHQLEQTMHTHINCVCHMTLQLIICMYAVHIHIRLTQACPTQACPKY